MSAEIVHEIDQAVETCVALYGRSPEWLVLDERQERDLIKATEKLNSSRLSTIKIGGYRSQYGTMMRVAISRTKLNTPVVLPGDILQGAS